MNFRTILKSFFDKKVKGAWFPQGSAFSQWWNLFRRSAIDYEAEVGDPMQNTIVAACMGWLSDAWPEAPPITVTISEDGEEKKVKHAAKDLLLTPNPWYGDRQLWAATLSDLKLEGNAYWHVIKDGTGAPVALYWLPTGLVEPRWNPNDPGTFITHYEYTPDGQSHNLRTDEIIHFREGFDPENIRKGRARFKSCLSEVFGDNEASRYVSTMLRNMGMAGIILSPKPQDAAKGISLNKEEAQAIADSYKFKTQGDKRGEAIMLNVPMDVHELGGGLSKMETREIRRIPEERICAVFKIPPGVVKLGAGLDRNTFSNANTEQEQAWHNCIIPLHGQISDVLDQQLLPLFGDPKGVTVRFDTAKVNALQEDQDAKVNRIALLWNSDLIKRNAALEAIGYKPEADDDVYRSRWMAEAIPDMEPREEDDDDDQQEESDGKKSFKSESNLEKVAARYRIRLLNQEAEAIESLLSVYRLAETQLNKSLKQLERRMLDALAKGEELGEGWLLKEARYRDLLKQIDVQMDRLSNSASVRLSDDQRTLTYLALESSKALSVAGGMVEANWITINARVVEQFIGYASDGSPLKAIFDELGPDMSRKVRDTIGKGLALGNNPRTIASEVKDAFSGTLHRAENITRTEMLRAYREVTRESYKANNVNKWAWLSAADSRTCAACFAMHGQIFDSGQKHDGHPQCRCAMVPVVKGGTVVDGGDQVFRSLSEEQQREILGRDGYELWSRGEVELSDFVVQTADPRWGTMRRAATNQEAISNARQRR